MRSQADRVEGSLLRRQPTPPRFQSLDYSMSTSQYDGKEHETAELLTAMMGGDLDPEVARRVLRKCNGDVQKAATAILEGDRGEDMLVSSGWNSQSGNTQTRPATPPLAMSSVKQTHASSVIDLTSDDDELSRALAASMESHSGANPSDQAPHPEWAVVRSNVESGAGMSQDEQNLSRVIEASLNSSFNEFATEPYEDLPLEKSVREGGRPVALRPTLPTVAYAALVLQALFFVPQVRSSIASWRPSAPSDIKEITPPTSGPELKLWQLVEMFANMDMAQLSVLVTDDILTEFDAQSWGTADRPGDLSSHFMQNVARLIENLLEHQFREEVYQENRPKLFHFSYRRVEISDISQTPTVGPISDTAVVPVETGGDLDVTNDLISRLSTSLSSYHNGGSNHDIITNPSQVVVFQLRPSPSLSSASSAAKSADQKAFQYPKHIYLDQFLHENFDLANQKRELQREMNADVQKLTLERKSLTNFNDKDTLSDLRASIHYYEHLADTEVEERRAILSRTAAKLKNILVRIENEIETVDANILQLKAEVAALFKCENLQQYRYDLRSVLVHDGLLGRKQIYSYVQDKGTWWKCVDTAVTEVSEDIVLADSSGIHLGAGPYMLMYSRALPTGDGARLPWPKPLKDRVKFHNRKFLSSLDPEIAAKALPVDSPPSSPRLNLPSGGTALDEIHLTQPAGEPMDLSGG